MANVLLVLSQKGRIVAREEFNEQTAMPFGMHKGIPLGDVPADYLLRWHKKYSVSVLYGDWKGVMIWVKSNLDRLNKEFRVLKAQYYKDNPGAADRELKSKIETSEINRVIQSKRAQSTYLKNKKKK